MKIKMTQIMEITSNGVCMCIKCNMTVIYNELRFSEKIEHVHLRLITDWLDVVHWYFAKTSDEIYFLSKMKNIIFTYGQKILMKILPMQIWTVKLSAKTNGLIMNRNWHILSQKRGEIFLHILIFFSLSFLFYMEDKIICERNY